MITAEEIRSRLAIDKSRLDDELEIHSQVAEQIANKVVRLDHEVALAADDLKRLEAGLVLDLKRDDTKRTVAEMDAMVVRDSTRREALKVHLAYTEQLGTWKGLQDAWKSKGFGIRALVDLYAANYYSSGSTVTSRRERDEVDTSYREQLRSRTTQQATADRSNNEEPPSLRRRNRA